MKHNYHVMAEKLVTIATAVSIGFGAAYLAKKPIEKLYKSINRVSETLTDREYSTRSDERRNY